MAPDDQYARIKAWCDANGHEILQRFDEIDVSRSRMRRPQLDRVLERISRGESDGIVVAEQSRFARTLTGALEALKAIRDTGGVFLAADGFDSTTPEGTIGMNIMLSFAQYELERHRATWQRATARAVADGVHVAPTPYGYRRPNKRAHLEVDPVTGPKVTEAFRLRASGAPWSQVSDVLGVARSSANGIITNDVYLGIAKGPHGQRQPLSHPSLTTDEDWHAAQPGTRTIIGVSRPVGALKGLVYCEACGFRMSIGGAKNVKPFYNCRSSSSVGKCAAAASISVHLLDAYVDERLEGLLWRGDPGLWAIVNDDTAYEAAKVALKQAQAERTAYVTKVSALDPDYEAGLAARDARVKEARRKLGSLPSPRHDPGGKGPDEYTIEDARASLARFVERVTVRAAGRSKRVPIADRVEIVWR